MGSSKDSFAQFLIERGVGHKMKTFRNNFDFIEVLSIDEVKSIFMTFRKNFL